MLFGAGKSPCIERLNKLYQYDSPYYDYYQ